MLITAVTDTASWQVLAGLLPIASIGIAAHTPGLISLAAGERPTLNSSGVGVNEWESVSFADQLRRVDTDVDGSEAAIDRQY